MRRKGSHCIHRLTDDDESYCFLQSSHTTEDGLRQLVFHGQVDAWPMRCDAEMSAACEFRRERLPERPESRLTPCPSCGRRHREGSTSGALCIAWHQVRTVLGDLRKDLPQGKRYFRDGTTSLPYAADTPDVVRRLLWPRIKSAVLRRDRYSCQDCGEIFGHPGRRVFDPSARRGKGAYRWERLEVHHIVPRYRRGSDHPGNLKTLCPSCHARYTQAQVPDFLGAARRRDETVKMLHDEPDEPGYPWDVGGD